VVGSFSDLSSGFEVIVANKGDVDGITLRVELEPEAVGQRDEVEGRLVDQLRLRTNPRYNLEFHEHATLPRYQAKAR
jgi:phenylacetate-CoA ligase